MASFISRRMNLHVCAPQNFGAREATKAELESNFSENVQGHWDTAHVIK